MLPRAERTRLTLVHGRILFRTALAGLLAAEPDFVLAAECANAVEATESLGSSRSDVVLLDFGIWQDLISPARNAGYHGKFLAVADQIAAAPCAQAISEGVSGVVLNSDSPARLVQAIHVVSNGGAWLDLSLIQLLAERYPHQEDLRLDGLSAREQAVLRGIIGGLSNRKIAGQIGTSESTVKAILQHLFDKTGVRTRSQLVRIVLTGPAVFASRTPV
jgi:DNA-binding NarL/FixJ family response regulator